MEELETPTPQVPTEAMLKTLNTAELKGLLMRYGGNAGHKNKSALVTEAVTILATFVPPTQPLENED